MRRTLVSSVLAIVVAFSAVRLSADSKPFLAGTAAGIELCPQLICGFALFVGQFEGQINSRPASGGFAAAVEHEDLPAVGETTPITGGDWTIVANQRAFSGDNHARHDPESQRYAVLHHYGDGDHQRRKG